MGTSAIADGGGIDFRALEGLRSSASTAPSWSLVRTSITSSRSLRGSGGAVSMRCLEAVDAVIAIESATCSNTSAQQTGGCIAFQMERSSRSFGLIQGLVASQVSALSGGALSVVVPAHMSTSYKDTIARSFTLSVNDTTVEHAYAQERGAAIRVEVAQPAVHHFRGWDPSCQRKPQSCRMTQCPDRYNSTVPPRAIGTEVNVANIVVADAATGPHGQGALASLSNTVARLTNVSVRSVSANFAGGLVAVLDSSDVTLTNVCGHNLSAANGALLYHSGAGANVTLDNVRIGASPSCSHDPSPAQTFEEGAVATGGHDISWIRSGTISLACVRGMHLACPLGSTVLDDSIGSFEQSFPSFVTVNARIDTTDLMCSVTSRLDYSPQTFHYSSNSIGCKKCPPERYTLVRQGWKGKQHAPIAVRAGVSFSALLEPTVAREWTKCFPCPIGADCSRGGSVVVPQPGRWGARGPSGLLLISPFPVLLFDYACRTNASGCLSRFDACNGDRVGMACGQCRGGFGEALNSARCMSDGACWDSGLRIAAWLLLPLGVVGIVLFYVVSSGAKVLEGAPSAPGTGNAASAQSALARHAVTTGLVSILVSLLQVEEIVRADGQGSDSSLVHASQFQLIPSWFGHPVCLWPGMGTVAKAMLPAMLSFSLPVVLVATFLAHSQLTLSGRFLARRTAGSMAPSRGRYKRAFVSLMVFAYGALASVATKLVMPLEVSGYGTRQALTGDVWAQKWYFWVGAAWLVSSTLWVPLFFAWGLAHQRARTMGVDEFAWGVVFPAPVATWRAVRRAVRGHAMPRSAESRKDAWTMFVLLSAAYRGERWWWDAVMLARRLAFVFPSLVLSKTPMGRSFVYVILSLASLVLHERQLPFRDSALNKVETASLSALNLLCVSHLLSAYQRTHGLGMNSLQHAAHTAVSWLFPAVAAAAFGVLALRGRKWGQEGTFRALLRLGASRVRRWSRSWARSVGIEVGGGNGRNGSLGMAALADPLLSTSSGDT